MQANLNRRKQIREGYKNKDIGVSNSRHGNEHQSSNKSKLDTLLEKEPDQSKNFSTYLAKSDTIIILAFTDSIINNNDLDFLKKYLNRVSANNIHEIIIQEFSTTFDERKYKNRVQIILEYMQEHNISSNKIILLRRSELENSETKRLELRIK